MGAYGEGVALCGRKLALSWAVDIIPGNELSADYTRTAAYCTDQHIRKTAQDTGINLFWNRDFDMDSGSNAIAHRHTLSQIITHYRTYLSSDVLGTDTEELRNRVDSMCVVSAGLDQTISS